jgi:hypothetical protein
MIPTVVSGVDKVMIALIRSNQSRSSSEMEEEIASYESAITINPSFHCFHYHIAKVMIDKNDFQNAITQLQLCIEKKPQHYPSYDLIGDLLIQQGQEDKLIPLYKQGLLAMRHNDTDYQKMIQKISDLGLDGEKIFGDSFLKNLQVISDFWEQQKPVCEKNQWVIIEAVSSLPPFGFGVTGINLLVAKFLQKLYGCKIAAWCTSSKRDYRFQEFLISFGVEKFITPNTDFGLTENQKYQLKIFSEKANSENFKPLMKDFKCDDVHIGDLVYDLLLRTRPLSTPIFDQSIIAALESGCLQYNFWKNFLHSCQVRFFISSHATVYNQGLISRVVVAKKGIVLFPRFNSGPLCTRYETLDELYDSPGFISEKLFLYFWNHHKNKSALIGKELVENIMGIKHSETCIPYETKAYESNKKVYTCLEFCEQLNLNPSRPIVIVASHVFNDCPHCFRHRLFVDYYEWLVETLRICSQIDSVNWIVKEHPHLGAPGYDVDQTAKKMVNNEYSSYQHIKLAPDDLSNLSLIDFCHAVVTVSGTIAHELACFGIPSILAGSSSYSECGFTNNPQSVDEYKALLYSIHKQDKLSYEKIEKAYVAYAIRYHYMREWETNFSLGGELLSTIESWAESWVNWIKSNKIGTIEETHFFENFMTQILLKKKHLFRFDQLHNRD